jgi:hypothetical protein
MFAIGTAVIETAGFFKDSEFTYVGGNKGINPKWGERSLVSPKVPTAPKLTDVDIAFRDDPALLPLILQHYQSKGGEILVSCQGSRVGDEADKLAVGVTGLSALDALDYISPASERTHGPKYYVVMSNKAPDRFFKRVEGFFGSLTTVANSGSVQFNSRDLAEWLMKTHGMLPRKRA